MKIRTNDIAPQPSRYLWPSISWNLNDLKHKIYWDLMYDWLWDAPWLSEEARENMDAGALKVSFGGMWNEIPDDDKNDLVWEVFDEWRDQPEDDQSIYSLHYELTTRTYNYLLNSVKEMVGAV